MYLIYKMLFVQLWNNKHNPKVVADTLKNSLKLLGLDYLDLYLIHWPIATSVNKLNLIIVDKAVKLKLIFFNNFQDYPIAKDSEGRLIGADDSYLDTWKAMEKCVRLGLTKSIGISNFNIKQVKEILKIALIKPAVNQVIATKTTEQIIIFKNCF